MNSSDQPPPLNHRARTRACRTTAYSRRVLDALRPLAPVYIFYLLGLAVFFGFRLTFLLNNFSRVHNTDRWYLLIPLGFRIDTMLLCKAVATPAVLLLLAPSELSRKFRAAFSLYFAGLVALFVFLEAATFPFMAEFDTRLNRIFLEHMLQVHEVYTMIFKGFLLSLTLGVSATVLSGWLTFSLFQRLLAHPPACALKKRISLGLITAVLFYFGSRASFIHHSANINLASFSTCNIANQLALNSTYSLGHALYTMLTFEQNPRGLYGKMAPEKMFARIRKQSYIPEAACTDPDIPLLHFQQTSFPTAQRRNLVIILEESLGAEYVGCLGGLPLTPNIDRLSREGLLFTNLYSTGTRTVRGIEAVMSGFPPTPGRSAVKLGLCQKNFFTIAELLRRRGYATEFIYGGSEDCDSMSSFFRGNGVQNIYDKKSFHKNVFEATWGVSDEDLFNKAHEICTSHGAKPFFSLILTTSNHDPFDFPEGRIVLYEQPRETRNNAVKYADYALGTFFAAARQAPYYKNTIFLIIADHSTRLQGQDLIPIKKFHIPGLLLGPNITPGVYARAASQIDMPPTLLDLLGISAAYPCPGRALLSLPAGAPGRAVMQYEETNAFMEDNRVVVLRPHMEPLQFTYSDTRLIPAAPEPELIQTALAHALLPGHLYYNRQYHLPNHAPEEYSR